VNFQYNTDYFPPAPFVDVTFISAAEMFRVGPFPAFVDSGADGTIVPQQYLDAIHAPPTVEMRLRSQWGEQRRVMLYLVDVRIGDINLPGIEVVGDELSNDIILGRDVLNRLRLRLDGPAGMTNVSV
jgi:predicted aspartyl protease